MNRIDTIRKRKNMSYGKIAAIAGITATYVSMLAKDQRKNPSLDTMQRIAGALGEKVERVFDIN